jgi:protein SCO1/2
MPTRLILAAVTLALCAAAAVAGVTLASRGHDAPALELDGQGFAGSHRPPGAGLPSFRLRDQDGRPVTAATVRGRLAIVAFLYSTCRDTCPAQVQTIRGALDDLGRDVPVYGISVDPADDTPARARAFMLKQGMTGRMRFLLGDRAALTPLWRAFGIQPQLDGLEHSAYVVLVDGRGRQRVSFPFDHLTGDALVHDLRRLGA